jgi:competence protein ComEA
MKLLQSLLLGLSLLASSAVFAEPVNINTANAEQIASAMTGVGESKAKAIVEYREQHGKFKSIQDLEYVDGIGEKTIEKNSHKLTM